MKKVLFGLLIAMVGMFAISCTKKEIASESYHIGNRLIPIESDAAAKTRHYLMTFHSGHSGKNCKGCVKILGVVCHIDCMNYGNVCSKAASVSLIEDGGSVMATTTDTFGLTSENYFAMPDRSLNYTDENNNRIFLNIPEQVVYRDSTTLQFTFTGLFFTNTPAYSND